MCGCESALMKSSETQINRSKIKPQTVITVKLIVGASNEQFSVQFISALVRFTDFTWLSLLRFYFTEVVLVSSFRPLSFSEFFVRHGFRSLG